MMGFEPDRPDLLYEDETSSALAGCPKRISNPRSNNSLSQPIAASVRNCNTL